MEQNIHWIARGFQSMLRTDHFKVINMLLPNLHRGWLRQTDHTLNIPPMAQHGFHGDIWTLQIFWSEILFLHQWQFVQRQLTEIYFVCIRVMCRHKIFCLDLFWQNQLMVVLLLIIMVHFIKLQIKAQKTLQRN